MPMHVCMCPAAHAEAANCTFGACGCPEAQATDSMILMPPFQEIVYLSALQLKASATKYASKLAAAIKTGKELELLKLSGEAIANNKRHQKEYEKQLQVRQDYLVAGHGFLSVSEGRDIGKQAQVTCLCPTRETGHRRCRLTDIKSSY